MDRRLNLLAVNLLVGRRRAQESACSALPYCLNRSRMSCGLIQQITDTLGSGSGLEETI
jgi:hypothetical protein